MPSFAKRVLAGLSRRGSDAKARLSLLSRNLNPSKDLILLFHGIDLTGCQDFNWRFTSVSDFLFIVNQLRRHFVLSPLSTLISRKSDKPRVALTFDDGYRTWRTLLLPLIEKHEIPVTLFISRPPRPILWTDQYDIYRKHCDTPISLGNSHFEKKNGIYRNESGLDLNTFLKASDDEILSRFQALAQLPESILDKTRTYWELLADEDITIVARSPLVEIGSHACTHASLPALSDQALRQELNQSRSELETLTERSVTSLSFPSGRYDLRVETAAVESGYERLLAENLSNPTDESRNPRLYKRYGIYSSGNRFKQLVDLYKAYET